MDEMIIKTAFDKEKKKLMTFKKPRVIFEEIREEEAKLGISRPPEITFREE